MPPLGWLLRGLTHWRGTGARTNRDGELESWGCLIQGLARALDEGEKSAISLKMEVSREGCSRNPKRLLSKGLKGEQEQVPEPPAIPDQLLPSGPRIPETSPSPTLADPLPEGRSQRSRTSSGASLSLTGGAALGTLLEDASSPSVKWVRERAPHCVVSTRPRSQGAQQEAWQRCLSPGDTALGGPSGLTRGLPLPTPSLSKVHPNLPWSSEPRRSW